MLPGSRSSEFTESSTYLIPFYEGTYNSLAILAADGFTQTNPLNGKGGATEATILVSVTKVGVLGGSVAFTRPDEGNNFVGGPNASAGAADRALMRPLGVFVHDAIGQEHENSPGEASGINTYMSGQGSYGNRLYETQVQVGGSAGNPITYTSGDTLYASRNGLLTNVEADSFEVVSGGLAAATVMGIVTHAPDSDDAIIAYDQRI